MSSGIIVESKSTHVLHCKMRFLDATDELVDSCWLLEMSTSWTSQWLLIARRCDTMRAWAAVDEAYADSLDAKVQILHDLHYAEEGQCSLDECLDVSRNEEAYVLKHSN